MTVKNKYGSLRMYYLVPLSYYRPLSTESKSSSTKFPSQRFNPLGYFVMAQTMLNEGLGVLNLNCLLLKIILLHLTWLHCFWCLAVNSLFFNSLMAPIMYFPYSKLTKEVFIAYHVHWLFQTSDLSLFFSIVFTSFNMYSWLTFSFYTWSAISGFIAYKLIRTPRCSPSINFKEQLLSPLYSIPQPQGI